MNGRRTDEVTSVLLLYPDSRAAALGSPGFRQVLKTLDASDNIEVDWGCMESTEGGVDYQRRRYRGGYDIVAFSVAYELLYGSVVRMLDSLGIEAERVKRGTGGPAVLLGGAAPTINPAVAGTIADMVFQGEAEEHLCQAVLSLARYKKTGAASKLTPMSDGTPSDSPQAAPRFYISTDTIDSAFLEEFDGAGESAFSDAGLVEVGRGCSRGCRFCAAGHVCLPARQRDVDAIFGDVESYKGKAGRIGLVGAAISDHDGLADILGGIVERGFGLTTSSFRADMLTEEIAGLLRRGGLKTVTIAPEGGSSRARAILNKRLTEEQIIDAAVSCRKAGFKSLKLYFIIGVPWENEEDTDAIVELAANIHDAFHTAGARLSVSVNPFIPKPQTPFQWCPMADKTYLKRVERKLGKSFRSMKHVSMKMLSIREAEREAVISLGDEAVGKAIIRNALDGVPWKRALKDEGVDIERLVYTMKDTNAVFPWDVWIERNKKTALRASFEKALNAAR